MKLTVPVEFEPATVAIRVMESPWVMVAVEVDSTVVVSALTVSITT